MFQSMRQWFSDLFAPIRMLPAGNYSYQSPADSEVPYRLHLRLLPNGNATLIVNAHTVLHLNQTAAEYAYHWINGTPEADMSRIIEKRYAINWIEALKEYRAFKDRVLEMVHTPDLDPEAFLGFDRSQLYSGDEQAPIRLDAALTYRTSSESSPNLAPNDRVKRELLTEEWYQIMDKAWQAGIPHIVFTGGEPTLRPDLPDLVAYAEKLGMVAGVITDGLRLTNSEYFHSLLQAGLDHLMIVLDPGEDQAWEAVNDVLPEDIFLNVHCTLTEHNASNFMAVLKRLADKGVRSFSLSTTSHELQDQLKAAADYITSRGLSLVWDLPVPYSPLHPVALEIAEHEQPPSGAGNAWLYIEPDGDVLPAQGVLTVMGNLLTDPWETIWANRPKG